MVIPTTRRWNTFGSLLIFKITMRLLQCFKADYQIVEFTPTMFITEELKSMLL